MKNEKETKTYRFEADVIKHAESNPLIPSFAEWACERYKKEFMDIDNIKKEMQMHIDMTKDCEEQLHILMNDQEKGSLGMLNSEEIDWIKEKGIERLKKGTFEGVYKYFITHFNRQEIKRRQFKLLINAFT